MGERLILDGVLRISTPYNLHWIMGERGKKGRKKKKKKKITIEKSHSEYFFFFFFGSL